MQIFESLKNTFPIKAFFKGTRGQILEKALDRAAGIETQQENPDKLLLDLGKQLDLYDVILLDDRVNFSHNLKKRLILSVPFSIISASDDPKDEEIAESVRQAFGIEEQSIYEHDFIYSFINMLDNGLDAMVYGNKCAEIVWKLAPDDKIFPYNFKYKHSQFFDFDYDKFANFNKLVIGRRFGEQRDIEPIEKIKQKFLIWVYPYAKDGNMYGDSDLREVYELYRAKKHIFRQRNIHLQGWGTPIPEIIYDIDKTTAGEVDELKRLLNNWQDNFYILNPGFRDKKTGELVGKFKLNIHEAKSGTKTDQFEKAIDQIDKQITRLILIPDKLGFSESPGGTYNLAEIQLNILHSVVEYMHKWLTRRMNPLIKMYVDFNFSNVTDYPIFMFNAMTDKIKGDLLKILIDTNVIQPDENG